MEIWKNIDGYDGYQVSNTGKVRGVGRIAKSYFGKVSFIEGKELAQRVNTSGYLDAHIGGKSGKMVCVHVLVAKAFVPLVSGREQVNHIDENKLNNNVENLEWCTQLENNIHGTRISRISEANRNPVLCINANNGFVIEFKSVNSAVSCMSTTKRTIKKCFESVTPYRGWTWIKRKEKNRPVVRVDSFGDIEKRYPSIDVASKDTGIKYNAIWRTCKGQTQRAGGIYWRYA